MRHFLSNFHNICSYNICLSYLSGIQIDAIDLLIISVLRQQRKYSSERKNKGNNKERVFRSISSQYNMCYVHGLWAKIHRILISLFKRLMEIFLDNMQLLKFLSKVKRLQLYKYCESIYVTLFFFLYRLWDHQRTVSSFSSRVRPTAFHSGMQIQVLSDSLLRVLLLNSFCTSIHDKYELGCMQTCYVKLRLGTTTMGEPFSLHQSYECCGINRDSWILFLLLPYRFHQLCNGHRVFINFSSSPLVSLLSVSLSFPIRTKLSGIFQNNLNLVFSPCDPTPLWRVHSLFPWPAQVFLSACSSCCSSILKKMPGPMYRAHPHFTCQREELHQNMEIS